MKLENQVVSLEIAKRLKELGVKQESLFLYDVKGILAPVGHAKWDMHFCTSAFTVAELGEMLPMYIAGKYTEYPAKTNKNMFSSAPPEKEDIIWEWAIENAGVLDSSETEADARGKMLIYLLENGLAEITK